MKKQSVIWLLLFSSMILRVSSGFAQSVLFDFNDAPLHSPFPVTITKGGITAFFSGTGSGYSIQDNSAPVFPTGFSGRDIYPSSVFLADLLIRFDKTLTDFSILYSCQELGCDDAATMRVTTYRNGSLVGTNTMTAKYPGTWPVDTLSCSFPAGFDSVVIHYDHRPPTCQDYGVIFLCDDMRVTEQISTSLREQHLFEGTIFPDPVTEPATISFSLAQAGDIHLSIYDLNGRLVKDLFAGYLNSGIHQFRWDADVKAGMYLLYLNSEHFSQAAKLVVLK